ncbi:MAG: sulfate permease [Candidatus Marinimicrobia bacterium]|nr:sulfate permease [Candidatus Neomarinimicrobiota bacterium]MCF7829404.1 sulfate permease [Candidatus Neomarinimicrobiota bacterium]MCF7880890.1 sulfate permease [Candidatus Neomarinimicrobiota bacterium]
MAKTPAHIPQYLTQPYRFIRSYSLNNLRADLLAGITVAVILLPQAIAFAMVAELPAEMGLYAAVVAAIAAALWGSSDHLQTGPTTAISILVFSSLLGAAPRGTPEFFIAASLLAVMAGIFQVAMGFARMGFLVNFVSDSVVIGFSAGAGVLIAAKQIGPLLGVNFSSANLYDVVRKTVIYLPESHLPTVLLGLGTIGLIILLRYINDRWPASLIAMVAASVTVYAFQLDKIGTEVIGELPGTFPPIQSLPFINLELIADLSVGALAVGAIGLVQTTAVSKTVAAETGQRLDSNQEFVGQGFANIAAGLFSGYPVAGSFTRTTVNQKSGAKTKLAAMISGGVVLAAMLFLAPLAKYLPQSALAGVLMVIAYRLVNWEEIQRIWEGTKADAAIMVITFLSMLFLPLEFAVLTGIIFSLALYIRQTSMPRIEEVLPDPSFSNFDRDSDRPACPQLVIYEILGDLYFGAANHIEQTLRQHFNEHSGQRYLLLRMNGVQHCDFSGINALESIVKTYRRAGGDVFFSRVQDPVLDMMHSTSFYEHVGEENFLEKDKAIGHIFHRVLDPAICIYECPVRAFRECQTLPKRDYPGKVPRLDEIPDEEAVPTIAPLDLWERLSEQDPPMVIDVREEREYEQSHIPGANLIPLSEFVEKYETLPTDQDIVLVCRGGRRSSRAGYMMREAGYDNVYVLDGGLLGWENADLLLAV